jgi:hypothetical protein
MQQKRSPVYGALVMGWLFLLRQYYLILCFDHLISLVWGVNKLRSSPKFWWPAVKGYANRPSMATFPSGIHSAAFTTWKEVYFYFLSVCLITVEDDRGTKANETCSLLWVIQSLKREIDIEMNAVVLQFLVIWLIRTLNNEGRGGKMGYSRRRLRLEREGLLYQSAVQKVELVGRSNIHEGPKWSWRRATFSKRTTGE